MDTTAEEGAIDAVADTVKGELLVPLRRLSRLFR
jgi:hypothetical protein